MSFFTLTEKICTTIWPNPEGGTPLYKTKTKLYVPPQRIGFLHRFGLKTAKDIAHLIGLESGMVFEETAGRI